MTITPYLLYEDADAALEFLARAFGFEEVLRHTGDGGYVNHAEMRLGDDVIHLGDPGEEYRNPEGHHWHFSQPIADLAPEDWGATRSG